MPSLVDLGGGGGGSTSRRRRTLPIVQNPVPSIGGNYDQGAVQRAVDRRNAPPRIQPLVSAPKPPSVRHTAAPSPAPKPPPVVVSNNQGNFTRPKPPPPVNPGPISGGGGGQRGNNQKPPVQNTTLRPIPTTSTINPAPVAPPAAPAPPELDQYLAGDTTYQGLLGQFGSQLTDFQSGQLNTRNQNSQSFAQRLRDLQQAQTADEANLAEDFAGRGLSNSGVYADALSQLQNQYLTSQGNLQSEQTNSEADLASQLANFQSQQAAAQQQAYLDAIARRAAQYGL